jgi:hypothetical protein
VRVPEGIGADRAAPSGRERERVGADMRGPPASERGHARGGVIWAGLGRKAEEEGSSGYFSIFFYFMNF